MLKAIRAATRSVKDTVGMSQGEDADTKKHLQEIKDAASTLFKTVSSFTQSQSVVSSNYIFFY
jgi:hypothetical protein